MNTKRLAIAVMTTAVTASMVNAHLPNFEQAKRQMGRPSTQMGMSTRATTSINSVSEVKDWDKQTEGYNCRVNYKGQEMFLTKHGDFRGTPLYWRGNWYPDAGDEPGEFADSGGTSGWGLANSLAFTQDKEYEWSGWNSNAGKFATESDGTDYGLVDKAIGDWGKQIDQAGTGAYLPTWRDGAEGAYSMIHDDIGAMNFATSVEPANEVGDEFPMIRVGWGVFVRDMDEDEWQGARDMVMDGHEMLNHSWDHTSAADQWQWAYSKGKSVTEADVLSIDDPALPEQLRGLVVGSETETYGKTITFKIPVIRYENDDVTKPITIETKEQSYQVSSDYTTKVKYKINGKEKSYEVDEITMTPDELYEVLGDYGWVDTINYASGRVKPNAVSWMATDDLKHPVLKIFCVPGWENEDFSQFDMYKSNITLSKEKMDKEIYSKIESPRFQKGKLTEYFVYPYDAYSKTTHDKLKESGMIAARGGAKSGRTLPGDFFHPFRIDFDAFFMMDDKASLTLSSTPSNPHQRISLEGLVERIVKTKGYMIREFHACAAVNHWNDANDQAKGGWWGGIPQNLYREHFSYLQGLIDAHKLVVFTPTEAVKYRLTRNGAESVTVAPSGEKYTVTVSMKEQVPTEYQDEISVIVKFDQAYSDMAAEYSNGERPRYAPRKMDSEGKAWSISINPYSDNGKVTLLPNEEHKPTAIKGALSRQNIASFAGIENGKVQLKLPVGSYRANIYSVSGRMVKSASIDGTGVVSSTALSTDDLGSGLFLLNVQQAGASVLKRKFIVK